MPGMLRDWVKELPYDLFIDPLRADFHKLNEIFEALPGGATGEPNGAYYTDDGAREPFRLRVQKALTVALRQIHPDNGFYCRLLLPASIVRGRRFFGTEVDTEIEAEKQEATRQGLSGQVDDGLRVSILEEPFSFEQDLAPATGRIRSEPYELILQGFAVHGDPEAGITDQAHLLLADVKRRLVALKEDERDPPWLFRFGNQENAVIGMTFDGGVVRPPDEISPTAHFWLRVSFDVSEDLEKPDE